MGSPNCHVSYKINGSLTLLNEVDGDITSQMKNSVHLFSKENCSGDVCSSGNSAKTNRNSLSSFRIPLDSRSYFSKSVGHVSDVNGDMQAQSPLPFSNDNNRQRLTLNAHAYLHSTFPSRISLGKPKPSYLHNNFEKNAAANIHLISPYKTSCLPDNFNTHRCTGILKMRDGPLQSFPSLRTNTVEFDRDAIVNDTSPSVKETSTSSQDENIQSLVNNLTKVLDEIHIVKDRGKDLNRIASEMKSERSDNQKNPQLSSEMIIRRMLQQLKGMMTRKEDVCTSSDDDDSSSGSCVRISPSVFTNSFRSKNETNVKDFGSGDVYTYLQETLMNVEPLHPQHTIKSKHVLVLEANCVNVPFDFAESCFKLSSLYQHSIVQRGSRLQHTLLQTQHATNYIITCGLRFRLPITSLLPTACAAFNSVSFFEASSRFSTFYESFLSNLEQNSQSFTSNNEINEEADVKTTPTMKSDISTVPPQAISSNSSIDLLLQRICSQVYQHEISCSSAKTLIANIFRDIDLSAGDNRNVIAQHLTQLKRMPRVEFQMPLSNKTMEGHSSNAYHPALVTPSVAHDKLCLSQHTNNRVSAQYACKRPSGTTLNVSYDVKGIGTAACTNIQNTSDSFTASVKADPSSHLNSQDSKSNKYDSDLSKHSSLSSCSNASSNLVDAEESDENDVRDNAKMEIAENAVQANQSDNVCRKHCGSITIPTRRHTKRRRIRKNANQNASDLNFHHVRYPHSLGDVAVMRAACSPSSQSQSSTIKAIGCNAHVYLSSMNNCVHNNQSEERDYVVAGKFRLTTLSFSSMSTENENEETDTRNTVANTCSFVPSSDVETRRYLSLCSAHTRNDDGVNSQCASCGQRTDLLDYDNSQQSNTESCRSLSQSVRNRNNCMHATDSVIFATEFSTISNCCTRDNSTLNSSLDASFSNNEMNATPTCNNGTIKCIGCFNERPTIINEMRNSEDNFVESEHLGCNAAPSHTCTSIIGHILMDKLLDECQKIERTIKDKPDDPSLQKFRKLLHVGSRPIYSTSLVEEPTFSDHLVGINVSEHSLSSISNQEELFVSPTAQ